MKACVCEFGGHGGVKKGQRFFRPSRTCGRAVGSGRVAQDIEGEWRSGQIAIVRRASRCCRFPLRRALPCEGLKNFFARTRLAGATGGRRFVEAYHVGACRSISDSSHKASCARAPGGMGRFVCRKHDENAPDWWCGRYVKGYRWGCRHKKKQQETRTRAWLVLPAADVW